MVDVKRLNHAVLFVSDLERSVGFYRDVLGFRVVAREGPMTFLRAAGSDNHHDLGLFGLGAQARRAPGRSVGLYHLAWEVARIEDLAAARRELVAAGAFVGESDHGATKSVYGSDPDGNELEVMWMIPREEWGVFEHRATVMPLEWERELDRFGQR
ncbi:MAG: VOC family protein [Actinomycetota bacterium]|nr:VOC family protein [Actinomycetota bacterium]